VFLMSQVPLYVEGYLRFFDTLDAAVVWDWSFFFTLVTGPTRSLRLKLIETRVYEPEIRARLGTTANVCQVVVLNLRLLTD